LSDIPIAVAVCEDKDGIVTLRLYVRISIYSFYKKIYKRINKNIQTNYYTNKKKKKKFIIY